MGAGAYKRANVDTYRQLVGNCYPENLNGGDARNIGEGWWGVEGSRRLVSERT